MAAATTKAKPKATVPAKQRTSRKRIVIPTPEEQARLATVPDKARYYDPYIGRTLPGGESDFEVYEKSRYMNWNVLIEGPTGSGKTSSVYAYAAWADMRLYSVSSSVALEPTQLFGKFIPDGKGGLIWQDGPVTDIVRHGGILLINEINLIHSRVSSVLFGLLDKRRKIELPDHKGEVIEAATDGSFLLFGDMNPDYEGTQPLSKALRNRFARKLFYDYDPAVEEQLVISKSLLELAKQMRGEIVRGTYDYPCTTNMLIEFEEVLLSSNMDAAVHNFANSFPFDDRASVRGVFDTWRANLDRDYSKFLAAQSSGKVTADDDDWGIDSINFDYQGGV